MSVQTAEMSVLNGVIVVEKTVVLYYNRESLLGVKLIGIGELDTEKADREARLNAPEGTTHYEIGLTLINWRGRPAIKSAVTPVTDLEELHR